METVRGFEPVLHLAAGFALLLAKVASTIHPSDRAPYFLAAKGEPTASDRLMPLMWRLLRGDKKNRCRLPDNNFVAMFDAVTHRANANSRTSRGYRPRSRLLMRLRE
jgi:hypothetical protein